VVGKLNIIPLVHIYIKNPRTSPALLNPKVFYALALQIYAASITYAQAIVHLQNIFASRESPPSPKMIPSRGLRWSSQTIGAGRRRIEILSTRNVCLQIFRDPGNC